MIQMISGAQGAAAALEAQRVRMDIVSQNIANAHVTKGKDGQPYKRQQVVFEHFLPSSQAGRGGGGEDGARQIRVARVEEDKSPPRILNLPRHPHADSQGNVALPNVNIHEEMVDLVVAARAFEANLAAIKTARSMALQSLSIGKR